MLIPALNTQKEREQYVINHVIPYVRRMPAQEIIEIAYEPKTAEQQRIDTETLVVLKQCGRLEEYASYRRNISLAAESQVEEWQESLVVELKGIAISVVLSDLVGCTFTGDDSSYDYNGVDIKVTEEMLDEALAPWVEHTTFV